MQFNELLEQHGMPLEYLLLFFSFILIKSIFNLSGQENNRRALFTRRRMPF